MTKRRKRRKKNGGVSDAVSIISSAALLVIAILMVIFVVFYIKNNSFLGGFLSGKRPSLEETSESGAEASDTGEEDREAYEEKYGLVVLADGNIMYVVDSSEYDKYDEDNLLKLPAASVYGKAGSHEASEISESSAGNTEGGKGSINNGTAGSTRSADSAETSERYVYCLADYWLDTGSNLYHFDNFGYACRDIYNEGAFIFDYDKNGILKKITYNENYRESGENVQANFTGLVHTKTLWAYMNTSKTLGSYTALMYKKTTDSLSHPLGGDYSAQYASPYAYTVVGNKIYYLAVPKSAGGSTGHGSSGTADSSGSATASGTSDSEASSAFSSSPSGVSAGGSDAALKNIIGKLFCMTPGAEYREIAAENVIGFKVIAPESGSGTPAVYYYDGTQIRRSVSLKKDENMSVISENETYRVDISEIGKAYLTLSGGQKAALQSEAFKAGNFTYSLAADGEITGVADKKTVSTGGYTYSTENGEAFGAKMARVIRKDKSGKEEVISSEFDGTVGNLHYDYDSSSIIAEYTDGHGNGGILKITLNGDVDELDDAKDSSGKVTLYAIENGKAVYKTSENGETVFKTARIAASVPIAAGVDPVEINASSEPGADNNTADGNSASAPGNAAAGGNASGSGQIETGSAPAAGGQQAGGGQSSSAGSAPGNSHGDLSIGNAPGGV